MSREDIPASSEAEEHAEENKQEVKEDDEEEEELLARPTKEGRREEGTETETEGALGVAEGLSGSCTVTESTASQDVENSSKGYTNT